MVNFWGESGFNIIGSFPLGVVSESTASEMFDPQFGSLLSDHLQSIPIGYLYNGSFDGSDYGI